MYEMIIIGAGPVVIGGGNSALDAAHQMTRIARRVYLININLQLGGEVVLKEKVKKCQV